MGYADFMSYSAELAKGRVQPHRRQDGVCASYKPLGYGGLGGGCLTCAYFNMKNCGITTASAPQYDILA